MLPLFFHKLWKFNFEPWILLMVLFLLCIHFSLTGPEEQVWQTHQSLEQCFDWDNVANSSLVHILPTQICAHMNFAVQAWKRTVETWEQTDCERGGHTFLMGVVRILTGFCAPLLCQVPQVYLKLPMPMDTNLHVCGREVNCVILPCQNFQVKVFRPKKKTQKPSQSIKDS